MKLGAIVTTALVALAAGVGLGLFGQPLIAGLLVASAAAAQPQEPPAPSAPADNRIRVTELVETQSWDASARRRAALVVDGILVASGHEVFVSAAGDQADTLDIQAHAPSRVGTYEFAKLFKFDSLADAGFSRLVVRWGQDAWGFSVPGTLKEGRILGPLRPQQLP